MVFVAVKAGQVTMPDVGAGETGLVVVLGDEGTVVDITIGTAVTGATVGLVVGTAGAVDAIMTPVDPLTII